MGRILNFKDALVARQHLEAVGKTVVFTNGIFDLLHVGHLDYLEKARAIGDVLIVGLNSDASARALKGAAHPILPEAERARLLAALETVDIVIVFDDLTAIHLIDGLRPDVYVKGGDYAHKQWPERTAAEKAGCRVQLIPFLGGHSTSQLIQRILERFGNHGAAG